MFTKDENTITGTNDDDNIVFDTFADSEGGIYEQVILYGLGGNDTINPIGDWFFQHLSIYGGEGDDVINDNLGGDFLSGDDGDDIIRSRASYGEHDTVFGGEGNDKIVITGDVQADGGTGNDTFVLGRRFGYTDSADLVGGEGLDTVVIFGSLQRVTFDSIEELQVNHSVTLAAEMLETITRISSYEGQKSVIYLTNATNINATLFDASFHGTITGSDSDDVLNFSRAVNSIELNGGDGDDILKGNSADNKLYAGIGDDTIFGGGGNDKIFVENLDHTAQSGTGTNLAFGGGGDDEITVGEGGFSTVFGGAGDDLIIGSSFGRKSGLNGEWHGGAGNDLFQLSYDLGGNLTIVGGAGKDILQFTGEILDSARIDVDIWKSAGIIASPRLLNDIPEISSVERRISITLSEGGVFKPQSVQGKVSFFGSSQNDTVDLSRTRVDREWQGIDLGRGDDTFIGTKLDDKVRGDRGNDTFVFNDHAGHDGIMDFTNNGRETDILDFSKSKIINNISDFKAHLSDDGLVSFGDTVIDLHTNAKYLGNLSDINFIF